MKKSFNPTLKEDTPVGVLSVYQDDAERWIVELGNEELHCSMDPYAAYHYSAGFLTAIAKMDDGNRGPTARDKKQVERNDED